MSAIVTKMPVTFSNPSQLPVALPDLGVSGVTNRWAASMLTGNVGDAVTAWPSALDPTVRLVPAGSGVAPTIVTNNGVRCVLFDGADDVLTAYLTAGFRAVVMLAQVLDAAGTTAGLARSVQSYRPGFNRNSAGQVGVHFPGSGSLAISGTMADWTVIGASYYTTTGLGWVRGNAAAAATSTVAGVSATQQTAIRIGINDGSSDYGNFRLCELITFDRDLSAADMATIAANLAAAYPAIYA